MWETGCLVHILECYAMLYVICYVVSKAVMSLSIDKHVAKISTSCFFWLRQLRRVRRPTIARC